jgi:hypothetical protein
VIACASISPSPGQWNQFALRRRRRRSMNLNLFDNAILSISHLSHIIPKPIAMYSFYI